jgi:predicted phage terminase large subunit-like protein
VRVSAPAWLDAALAEFEPPPPPERPTYPTPGALAVALNPGTVQTPALDAIDAALVKAYETPDARLIITMPPQEGKSTRVAGDFPAWWLTRDPDARIVVASYGQSLATRNGSAIRSRIASNPEATGLRIAPDNGSKHEWTLDGHVGGVFSIGIGGGLTGRPADLLVIDDPIKDRKEADSETYRQNVWDWWTDVASTRLAPGAPVVVILTRWHEDDLAGRLIKSDDEDWTVLNIPAEADHDPAKGETDPLGREPGEFMLSARRNKHTGEPRTVEQWQRIKRRGLLGATWTSLYQGRPSPASGTLFLREDWQRYDEPLHVVRPDGSRWVPLSPGDELCQSWDMAFKDTASSDYVVGGVWLRRGVQACLLDLVWDRLDFTGSMQAVLDLTARWPQAVAKYVEDKANGTAVINMLARTVPGLIPVEPEGGKLARANAVAPFVKARNVWLPVSELLPAVSQLVDQAAAFPNGAHDDGVDMTTQALNRLLLNPILTGPPAEDSDEYDDLIDEELRIGSW